MTMTYDLVGRAQAAAPLHAQVVHDPIAEVLTGRPVALVRQPGREGDDGWMDG